jgi:excisionase family DNA binding protein
MEMQNRREPLLNEDQVAAALGVKKGTLQVWRSNKRYPLPYVKVGRNVRYTEAAVSEFIAQRTVVQGGV